MKESQLASQIDVDVDLGPRLCVSCVEDIVGPDKAVELIHSSNCITCELIRSSLPSNRVLESEEEIRAAVQVSKTRFDIKEHYSEATIWDYTGKHRNYGELRIMTGNTDSSTTIPEVINFETIAGWLKHCENVHGTSCLRDDSPLRLSEPIDVLVVDVVRNCLTMKTTATRYLALSYVWGNAITPTTTTTTINLPVRMRPGSLEHIRFLPKTISDAIELTREMGVRYLWADCLSIVQDSPKKHQEIQNIDIIYAQAALTIVAVGGEDATLGLAGVRPGTRRKRITTITHGNYTAKLSLPTHKHYLLFGTAYNSRGWTFQELLLSKRLLFLTEHQASFHCGLSLRSEAVPEERFEDIAEFGDGTINLQTNGGLSRSPNAVFGLYTAMVREYTRRRLSYEDDIENAFSALASILYEWCGGSPIVHGMMSSLFCYSLLWTFREDQSYWTSYTVREMGWKRVAFPSWSWVGWTASVTHLLCRASARYPLQSLIKDVVITSFDLRNDSVSHTVRDRSAAENGLLQLIRIDFKPAESDIPCPIPCILEFEAERMHWNNCRIEHRDAAGHILVFTSICKSLPCGILSLVPMLDIIEEVRSQQAANVPQHEQTWSLIRTYRFESEPTRGLTSNVLDLLNEVKKSQNVKKDFVEDLQRQMELRDLLAVLLVRPQGSSWERIGSGIMLEEDWPSTSEEAEIRAYKEHIVLV